MKKKALDILVSTGHLQPFVSLELTEEPDVMTSDASASSIYSRQAYESRRASTTPAPLVFHVVSQCEDDPSKVTKNLGDRAAAAELCRSREVLTLFQLEHPAQLKPLYPSYGKEKDPCTDYVSYVDMMSAAMKTDHYGYTRLTPQGRPSRVNITADMTGRQLYAIADRIVKRFVHPHSIHYENPENRVFYLVVTNTWGSQVKREILDNDDVLNIPLCDAVGVVLKKEADRRDHLSFEEYHFVRKVGTVAATEVASKSSVMTVQKCLDKFIEREQLNPEETLYCSGCRQHLAPVKKMDLWATPQILILHLKRFQFVPGQYFVHRYVVYCSGRPRLSAAASTFANSGWLESCL